MQTSFCHSMQLQSQDFEKLNKMKRRLTSYANQETSSVETKKIKHCSKGIGYEIATVNNRRPVSSKVLPQVKKTASASRKSIKNCGLYSDLAHKSSKAVEGQNRIKTPQKRSKQKKSEKITKMDVDTPDVAETFPSNNKQFSPLIYVVVDTNVFLDSDELKAIDSLIEWYPLPGKNFKRTLAVVPWVVLQELDHLKSSKTSAKEARRAVTFLNKRFCAKKPGLRGQTILEAASVIEGLNIEVEDDRILQCCFFFKNSPGRHKTLLFSKDNNLCNKAVVNHIETFTTFTSLVKHIRHIAEANLLEYDDCSSLTSSVTPIGEEVSSKPTQNFRRRIQRCNSSKKTEKTRPPVNKTELEESIETSLQKSLGFVLTKEMIAAYGKDIWLEIVLKKPPWTLKEVFMCIKKHWLAVFSSNFDRLLADLVDSSLQFLKSSYAITSPDRENKEFRNFANYGLELLKGFAKKHGKEEVVKTSLAKLQKSVKNLKILQSSKASSSAETRKGLLPHPSSVLPAKIGVHESVSKNQSPRAPVQLKASLEKVGNEFSDSKATTSRDRSNYESLPENQLLYSSTETHSSETDNCRISASSSLMDEHMVLENLEDKFSEENFVTFWESLDEVWSCIIDHCASIFKSLSFQVKSAPSELQHLLVGNTPGELPHPTVAIKVIPLLSELINGFIVALERFLSYHETDQFSSDLSSCSDLLQTLWTITKAFNMQSRLENVKPTTVLQACSSHENKSKLINGFAKLKQVFGLLNDCASHFLQCR